MWFEIEEGTSFERTEFVLRYMHLVDRLLLLCRVVRVEPEDVGLLVAIRHFIE